MDHEEGRIVLESRSPKDGRVIGSVYESTPNEVYETIDRARNTARRWRESNFAMRRNYLLTVRDVLMDRIDEIVDVVTAETGKPEGEALAAEILVTADLIGYCAGRLKRVFSTKGAQTGLFKTKRAYKVYEPYGVVGVISPWNFPFYLTLAPVVSAIAAGNTVVIKPSEHTPLVGSKVIELFEEAARRCFIAGAVGRRLVELAQGGPEIGEALVKGGVDKVAFTGSVETGKKVGKAASENLTEVLLELGGKDPMIVCSDANVKRAAGGAVWGAFSNAGQACISIERAYVHQAVYDEFTSRVADLAGRIQVGREYGPITHAEQLEVIEDHLADARSKGAEILVGGERNTSLGELYFKPTVLTGVDHTMKIMREETFGPVLPIMRTEDEREALTLANDTVYGLNSSIFSNSREKARALAAGIKSGGVCINDVLISSAIPGLPYGGYKQSGIGYAHGDEGLLEFARAKAIAEDRLGLSRELMWFPIDKNLAPTLRRVARVFFRRGLANKMKNK